VKYTSELPAGTPTTLSMTIPLVPLGDKAVAVVALLVVMAAPLLTSKDIMHPVPAGQVIGANVLFAFA
jgi:hypothetical protein